MKLTIIQFIWGLKAAGKERVVVDLAKAFHDLGHKSLVCTLLPEMALAKELQKADVTFKCFGLKRTYALSGLRLIINYIRKVKPHAVIIHGASGTLMPRIALILMRIPVVLYVEHTMSSGKKFYHVLLNRIFFLFTDKVVCVSKEVRRSILESEKTKSEKVITICNGLHTSRFAHVKNVTSKQNGYRRIGVVGRFYEEKGHIYFVEAAKTIVESFEKVQFVFVGDGPLKPMIEQKVKEYELEKYCQFLGMRLDIENILPTLDVFVISSLYEGLPISLLEAQYFGIASVSTDVGGIPEVIEDGYNGLLVPPKDPQKLASEVIKVLTNDKLRNNIAANSRKVFNDKFNISRTAQSYLDLIYSILDKAK